MNLAIADFLLGLGFAALVAGFLSFQSCRSDSERVAYLEGRYGLSHADAVALSQGE